LFSSDALTRGIRITVQSRFEPDRSAPDEGQWFFSYHVRIANEGERVAQLVSRHWIITDGDGKEQVVRGPGVVGEQPVLEPGEAFEYTSGCPLGTPVGSMRGTYRMVAPGGEAFDAEIAPFGLAEPRVVN
jgi:ApaG protein